jgi:peptide/nickel transport system permease protein
MKTKKAPQEREDELKKRSQVFEIWDRLKTNKLAMLGLVIVILLVFCAVFADVIAPYDINAQDYFNRFVYPCKEHLMGTDNYGRDIFSRVIYGGRISLLVSLMAIACSVTVGGLIGAISGYFGGKVDTVIMRVMDVLMAIPGTLLAICVSAILGNGVWQTAIAVAVGGVAPSCRMMRATALSIRGEEYIEAARACGSTNLRAILTHVIPNCLAPIIVDCTLRLGGNIMMISGLSFIGLGVQAPTPEWGSMLNAGREFIREFYPLITFPGLAIMLTMFGFNMFGDGLRDAMDPKLKD